MKGQLQVKNKRRRSMRVSCSMKSVFYEGKKSCKKYAHIKPALFASQGYFFYFFPLLLIYGGSGMGLGLGFLSWCVRLIGFGTFKVGPSSFLGLRLFI